MNLSYVLRYVNDGWLHLLHSKQVVEADVLNGLENVFHYEIFERDLIQLGSFALMRRVINNKLILLLLLQRRRGAADHYQAPELFESLLIKRAVLGEQLETHLEAERTSQVVQVLLRLIV